MSFVQDCAGRDDGTGIDLRKTVFSDFEYRVATPGCAKDLRRIMAAVAGSRSSGGSLLIVGASESMLATGIRALSAGH